ncbi:hypothetical protein DCW30_05610 [Streptomyces alfalfae]|uniref:Uncharacterized protein n=1 Tax=Streptomyces alfalfae TaxID=1642299 RepID=A0ABM6GXS1_9ACTN|nr:hypothetical protein [Streptomyces alfalfae]APY88222.1 hypothetical protein A7J05_23265 [Streptomyces alfalfae]AYA18617.1 hypothetical protein D3X13_22375 [Streptomyces fradiae]RXX46503.1 hypothetical protein DCW30_05610 [Streptomyces alfalfae]RZM90016.1 hypothetical protein D4104_25545 [Streptomyces alfalfae]
MTARHVIEQALRAYYVDSAEPNAIARDLLAQYDAERDEEKATATPAATATPRPAPDSSRERRLEQLLDAIRTHGGKWTTRQVQETRRRKGEAPQRGTARRDLAELARRGHLVEHGPADGRYYLLATRKDGRRA